MRKPIFYIVGAPKSGTTSMHNYLKGHPRIIMPEITNIGFFSKDLHNEKMTEKEYLDLFKEAEKDVVIGTCAVWNLYSKIAAKEIKKFCPQAKIIIMLRNPVEMLYSLHSQLIYDLVENINNFEEALKAEKARKRGKKIPKNIYNPKFLFYSEIPRYTNQVKRYLDLFGKKNVLIILFEDFINNTDKVYKKTLNFLCIQDDFQLNYDVINANKKFRNQLAQQFLTYPPEIIAKFGRAVFPLWARKVLANFLFNLNRKYIKRPPLKKKTKNYLKSEFEEEIANLSKLINRNLDHWLEI